jgi:hydroxymethylpyrimidine pyrophosphatase-like HAD family hydrolase
MFEVAGLAIAMGNASDELKQYADEITLDHNENGILILSPKAMT